MHMGAAGEKHGPLKADEIGQDLWGDLTPETYLAHAQQGRNIEQDKTCGDLTREI